MFTLPAHIMYYVPLLLFCFFLLVCHVSMLRMLSALLVNIASFPSKCCSVSCLKQTLNSRGVTHTHTHTHTQTHTNTHALLADDILYFAGDLSQVELIGYRCGLQLVTSENEDGAGEGLSAVSYCCVLHRS